VTAADGARNVVALTVVRQSPTQQARLSSLELLPAAALEVRPAFRSDRFVFDATVPTDRATVRVRLTRVHVNATVTVDGAHSLAPPTPLASYRRSHTRPSPGTVRCSLSLSLLWFPAYWYIQVRCTRFGTK